MKTSNPADPQKLQHKTYRPTSVIGNAIRGAMIGVVETIPGVSGGTVALVVGIYEQLIDSAAALIGVVKALIVGPDRTANAKVQLGLVQWKVVIPALVGMLVAVFTVAGPMVNLVENYPEHMRSIFFGMVLASVLVPLNIVRADEQYARQVAERGIKPPPGVGIKGWYYAAGIVAAVLVLWLVSQPPAEVDGSGWLLIPVGAVAISALVLPGISGSFILLTMGLYEPTLRAVDNFDIGYLAVLSIGFAIGLVVIVKALQYLLEKHHTLTLIVLAGIMVGAMRSLWPWQDDGNTALAPADNWPVMVGLGALGFGIVFILVVVDQRMSQRAAEASANVGHQSKTED